MVKSINLFKFSVALKVLKSLSFSLVGLSFNYWQGPVLRFSPLKFVSQLNFLKTQTNFTLSRLIDLVVLDFPTRSFRFSIIYLLQSLYPGFIFELIVNTSEELPISSVYSVFKASN